MMINVILTGVQDWLAPAEVIGFIGAILTGVAMLRQFSKERVKLRDENATRLTEMDMRATKHEIGFAQYEKDYQASWSHLEELVDNFLTSNNKLFSDYLATCDSCRKSVQMHHEQAEKHVTPALLERIESLSGDIKFIREFLIREGNK